MINTLPTWEGITFFLKTQIILLGQLLGLSRIIFPLHSYDISGFSPCISGSDTSKPNSLPSGNQTWLARQIHHLLRWFPSYKAPIIGCFFPQFPLIFLKRNRHDIPSFDSFDSRRNTDWISPIPSLSLRTRRCRWLLLPPPLPLPAPVAVSRVHGVSDHLDLLIRKPQKATHFLMFPLWIPHDSTVLVDALLGKSRITLNKPRTVRRNLWWEGRGIGIKVTPRKKDKQKVEKVHSATVLENLNIYCHCSCSLRLHSSELVLLKIGWHNTIGFSITTVPMFEWFGAPFFQKSPHRWREN